MEWLLSAWKDDSTKIVRKKGLFSFFCCQPAANAENFKECRRKKTLAEVILKTPVRTNSKKKIKLNPFLILP